MIFEEKKIGSERIYEGAILNVRRDKVTAVKGYAYREIIEHNGAVAVVPIKDNGNIVMVEQYRELKEETGYTAENIRYLGKINTSVAYSEEVIHMYAMTGLNAGEQDLDDDEAINVIEMPFEEVYKMAYEGRLIDAKTVAGLLMAKEQLSDILIL